MKYLFLLCSAVTALTNTGLSQTSADNTGYNQDLYNMTVEAGWNLLSLPLAVHNSSKNSIFPAAASEAFVYQGVYVYTDTLANGYGFWLKFNLPQDIVINGEIALRDTIEVMAGWNLIGSPTVPVDVNTIIVNPPGIITSEYFYYSSGSGYQSSDTMQPGRGYWVKANQSGWLILAGSAGNACPGMPAVEYEGRAYNTVQIGNQCWLKENLDVGIRLDGSVGQADNGIIEKYCYSDDTTNCDLYGGLYVWDEAMQYDTTEGARGICPEGWHIPALSDWDTLVAHVNNDGNSLKAIGQGDFDGIGTNTTGFSGLLTGYHHVNGGFFELNSSTFFWSTTRIIYSDVYGIGLYAYWSGLGRTGHPSGMGYSVRCVKDQ